MDLGTKKNRAKNENDQTTQPPDQTDQTAAALCLSYATQSVSSQSNNTGQKISHCF